MLHDMVRAGYNMSKGADEVSVPGTSLHGSFVGAVTFYLLVIANPVLTSHQGYILVSLLLVCLHTQRLCEPCMEDSAAFPLQQMLNRSECS